MLRTTVLAATLALGLAGASSAVAPAEAAVVSGSGIAAAAPAPAATDVGYYVYRTRHYYGRPHYARCRIVTVKRWRYGRPVWVQRRICRY